MIGSISLCGIPFISGFYSKDVILEIILMGSFNIFAVVISFMATLFTVGYSVRLSLRLFLGITKRERFSLESDATGPLGAGIKALIIPSIIGGFFLGGFLPFNDGVILPV